MASSIWLFFFCSIVMHLVALMSSTNAQQAILEHFCLSEQGNFSTNSTYQQNLKHLISSISRKKKLSQGLYKCSYGENPDIVNVMALCRGDVQPDSCRSCVNNATLELTNLCPNQKEAVIWYDYCMFRYSSRYFFGNMEFGPYFWMYNLKNIEGSKKLFNMVLTDLLDRLTKKAASRVSLKFATGDTTSLRISQLTIYALVQCTPDLSKQQCSDCLSNATALLPKCCDGKQGGRVVSPSCNFRYERDKFYLAAC